MSVAGIDIGSSKACIAVARKRGIDVLMNKTSKRETPSLVSFGAKNRQLGTDAEGGLSISPRNTIFQLKRLLGKKFSAPDVQEDIQRLPYEVREGPDGDCQVVVDYLGERTAFSPEQLMAMLLVDMKAIAETDGSPVTDCVLSVPTFYTEAERYAMLNAAQIAGVNCLRLINETTATALAYGIYKTDLSESEPVSVVFVDVGADAFQVSIVAFKKGQLRVLAHAWDRNLGGRDFDAVLFDHFAAEFQEKHKLDVRTNARASFRLRVACEKLKKLLSSIPEAPMNVECLMNDLDFRSTMTREKFEELAQPVLERAKAPLAQALAEAGVSAESLASVEVVGGSSRVPALMRILRDFFGREPSRTLNATECVSRGCALNCAMLSPIFRVRDFEVIDAFPFGIQFSWEKDGEPTTTVLFERGGPIPSAKMLTFFRNQQFTLTAAYTEDSPLPRGFNRTIGTFTVGPPPHVPGDGDAKAKLKVKVRLNLHGVISVENAQQIEEEEYEETVKKAPAVVDAKAADEQMTDAGTDEKMNDAAAGAGEPGAAPAAGSAPEARPAEQNGQAGAGTAEPAGAGAAADVDAGAMEADAATAGPTGEAEEMEVVKKKRVKKLAVPYSARTAGLSQAELEALHEKECQMALQDRVQEETNEKKNALEAYIYSLRGKLAEQLAPFASDAERTSLSELLDNLENWLYDEGEDEKKSVYVAKLDELRAAGEAIMRRALEASARPVAASSLAATCERLRAAATSSDAKLAHIPQGEKDQVVEECDKAAKWLAEKQAAQGSLRQTDDPVLTAEDLRKREGTVLRFCEPLLSKPPPPPKSLSAQEEKKAEGEGKPENVEAMDTDAGGAAPEAMDAGEECAAAGPQPTSVEEPMEQ